METSHITTVSASYTAEQYQAMVYQRDEFLCALIDIVKAAPDERNLAINHAEQIIKRS